MSPLPPAIAGAAAIDVGGFKDSTGHWRHINEPERVMQPLPGQPSYKPGQVREICDNILLFQRDNGGWPKDYDMLAILTDSQVQAVRDSRNRADTTFDNHTTHTQVAYLARAFAQLKDAALRDACLRGLAFIFDAQYPNGGFPQRHPNHKGIAGHITFNDGVMTGIMGLLDDIAKKHNGFEWIDDATAQKARAAVDKGVACILAMQYRNKQGVLQGWGQQHDAKTLAPAPARTFELVSLSPQDTVKILNFLMKIERPGAEVARSIQSAAAWLETAKLTGIRVERFKADYVEFHRHKTGSDVRVVEDADAPPLWARMVELETNRPVFASRDGIRKYSLAEVDRERRTGSGWYGPWPDLLLKKTYPAWLKKNHMSQ
ncbi:MAG: pectate lyase [Opitutaceae bacterium]|jgi:PelA/Pel-15E family pectate lyase|nr:pectate lyase [Opitutaceae bacterium]